MNKILHNITLLLFLLAGNNFIYCSGTRALPELTKTGNHHFSLVNQNKLNAFSGVSLTSAIDLENDLEKKDLLKISTIHFPFISCYIPDNMPASHSGIFISFISLLTKQYILTFMLRI